jgi:competence protein ComEA
MKGCLNYTKEASGRHLRLPDFSKRSRVLLLAVAGVLAIALVWIFWPGNGAQGFEVTPAQATAPENNSEPADDGAQSASEQVDGAGAGSSAETDPAETDPTEATSAALSGVETDIVVYLSGAVKTPGVYHLPLGARVDDGVRAAGGLNEDAAAEFVNLAAVLEDGQQVHIPTRDEIAAGTPQPTGTSSGADGGSLNAQATPGLVNINTADSTGLETLPGIGPATAQRIIAYREANGAFLSIEELKQVSGIGEKKYAALAALICV